MDKKPLISSSKGKRTPDLGAARTLILSVGFALILGLWTLFSKQLNQAYSANNSAASTAGTLPSSESGSGQALELPPLPTLIPQASASVSGQLVAPLPKAASVIPAVPAQAPVKIFLGGAKPQARSQVPAPLTRTSSSRP